MIANKYDALLGRDLRSPERLHQAFANIEFMRRYLVGLESKLNKIPDDLTDKQLSVIDASVEEATKALQNAYFLGQAGYYPQDIKTISWED